MCVSIMRRGNSCPMTCVACMPRLGLLAVIMKILVWLVCVVCSSLGCAGLLQQRWPLKWCEKLSRLAEGLSIARVMFRVSSICDITRLMWLKLVMTMCGVVLGSLLKMWVLLLCACVVSPVTVGIANGMVVSVRFIMVSDRLKALGLSRFIWRFLVRTMKVNLLLVLTSLVSTSVLLRLRWLIACLIVQRTGTPTVSMVSMLLVISSGRCLTSVRLTVTLIETKNRFSSSFPKGRTRDLTLRWNLEPVSSMLVTKVLSAIDRLVSRTSYVALTMISSVVVENILTELVCETVWNSGGSVVWLIRTSFLMMVRVCRVLALLGVDLVLLFVMLVETVRVGNMVRTGTVATLRNSDMLKVRRLGVSVSLWCLVSSRTVIVADDRVSVRFSSSVAR